MKIVRFAAAPDGGSQFVEIDFPVDNASTDSWGHTARRSAVLSAQSTMVTEMPEGLYQDWHPPAHWRSKPATGRSTDAAAGKCFSPTMSAAAAIARAPSAARPASFLSICSPKPLLV